MLALLVPGVGMGGGPNVGAATGPHFLMLMGMGKSLPPWLVPILIPILEYMYA